MNCFQTEEERYQKKMGNKASAEITTEQQHDKLNSDPNNNNVANDVSKIKEKSRSLPAYSSSTNKSKTLSLKRNKKKGLFDDIPLRIGEVIEETIVPEIKDRVIHELQNTMPRYRQLITQPMWRESINSLKSEDTVFKLGEKKSGLNSNYSGPPQDYHSLRDQCLREGQLFEDPAFSASDASFYLHGKSIGGRKFKWLRPSEIVSNPLFFSEGAHRFDVCQGELGNCWFLAAVANLTLNSKLFTRVVPTDQSFEKSEYAGIFHFRFWQYGKWVDVVVDDRLPTVNGKLVMMHSKDVNEFWSALLEKAYAKLHGSYESLKGGTTSEAMEDFTGGLTEHYEIQSEECPQNLFTVMLKAHQRGSFMGCSISVSDASQMESVLSNGLIKGHAYSITSVKLVQIDHLKVQGKIPLLRVRNPWGNEAEWKGAWSDKSREWTIVSDAEKKQLGLSFDTDGEFWISFVDFKKNFTNIEITNLTPDSLDDENKRRWEVNYFEGQWIPGVSSGGCRNHLETFHMNPQYMITLVDQDEDDDDNLCTCVVALMQKNHRIKRKMGLDNLTIGFAIYEIKDNTFGITRQSGQQTLSTNFFRYNASVARSPSFINLREVNGRFRLKPGRYCIIPSTFEPNQKGDFIIRFFTEKPAKNVMENDDEISAVKEKEDGEKGDTDDKDDKGKQNGNEDEYDENAILNGPAIDEKIFGDYKPDPDDPNDDGNRRRRQNQGDQTGGGMDLMQWIGLCMSILNMARDCYDQMNKSSETKQFETLSLAATQKDSAGERGPAEKSAYEFFAKIAGEDMEVDSFELQKIINHVFKKELKFEGFTVEACRSMVALMDSDDSGKLGFDEFVILWRNLRNWSEIFRKHDSDKSMTISAGELKEAFYEVGINVNRKVLRLLVNRYGHRSKETVDKQDQIYFNDFISCALKMKRCIEMWNQKKNSSRSPFSGGGFPATFSGAFPGAFSLLSRSLDPKSAAESTFTLDEFIREVLYS